MIRTNKNTYIIKFSIHAAAMLNEMDEAKTKAPEADDLRVLLERILDEAYQTEFIRSKPFLQNLEHKFDTAIRKTAQEFNIKI